jgi:glycosyltransferase involved in cell wall biosynthesis
VRIGIIARSDNTGLGNQTRELVQMLNPDKIMLIDFSPLNGNEQHPEWYYGYNCINVSGFATDEQVVNFLGGLDVIISCEIFYNPNLIKLARSMGVKTVLQYNYEFFDNFRDRNLDFPDALIAPSMWNFEQMQAFVRGRSKLVYIPPPTTPTPFLHSRKVNMETNSKRILHVAGKRAARDRNGTDSVINMMRFSDAKFELVVRSQTPIAIPFNDSRITIEVGNIPNREDLYTGFDAMVLPRRYAGLCLPMNEALMSGLPVFMTDISPNNQVLPKEWLTRSRVIGQLKTKVLLDLYDVNVRELANRVDDFVESKDKHVQKAHALDIGLNSFSPDILREKYLGLLKSLIG